MNRGLLEQVYLGFDPNHPAIQILACPREFADSLGQLVHAMFDQHDLPQRFKRIARPAHLPFLMLFRILST